MAEVFPLQSRAVPGFERMAAGNTALEVAERRPGSIVEVALWAVDAALASGIAAAAGCGRAPDPGRATIGEYAMLLSTGPARYLAISAVPGLDDALADVVGPDAGAVVDLTHGRAGLRISGPASADLLQKGLAFDLGGSAFPVGAAAVAGLHHMGVTVIRTGEQSFDVFIGASLAGSLWDWVTDSAVEYGFRVGPPAV